MEEVLASIFTPGHIHPLFVWIMDFALVGLALVLLFQIVTGSGTVHHYFLSAMSVGLLLSVHWFLYEAQRSDKEEKSE